MAYVFKHRNPPPQWRDFKTRAPHPWLALPFFLNWLADWLAYFLGNWPLVELLEHLGSFSILFAVIFYFAGVPGRLKQKHYQAWQVINSAQGKGGNGGRIDALKDLNEDHCSLIGVDLRDAYLEGLPLQRAQARRANFSSTDLRRATFNHAHLEDAEFLSANLRSADLRGAVLTGSQFDDADLNGASLAQADVSQASFARADLRQADLSRITNWQTIKNIRQANILGIRNAPEGFAKWAKQMGAIETNAD